MNKLRSVICLSAVLAMGAIYFTSFNGRVAVADNTVQSLPYTQDWSDTSMITTNDDWSGVPGVIGYRGDDLSTTISVDLLTVLADGSATPVDVVANGTNPNTSTSGGIGEFEITDPVVALQGSGTADIPHLVFHITTVGKSGIRFQANLRDIDGSGDDAEQPINIQYRVGGAGDYANVPGGFFADVTTGPDEAGMVTPVDVTLPSDADDQALVEIRVMTTNVFGSDEWVGIDDVSITDGGGTTTPGDAPVDFDGDGKTDISLVRNSGEQSTWLNLLSTEGFQGIDWGTTGDEYVPADYDGDGKDDVAVWRAAPEGSVFYILQSATNTMRIDNFGQIGDKPHVVGDYNGDGNDDVAVYRGGGEGNAESFWYYRTEVDGPITYVQWGTSGDFPAPGDYDGDGSNDFVVMRDGGGQAIFWQLTAAGTTSVAAFGLSSDLVAPGDYDGDGKTDYAVIRSDSGALNWYALRSSDGGLIHYPFGISGTDTPVIGDYDGDGTADAGVFRPSTTPGESFFYLLNSETSSVSFVQFGQSGDTAVAGGFIF